jgi:Flp pilus assembly protein TadG
MIRRRSLRSDEHGSVLVEFALVAPLMGLLLLGGAELTQIVRVDMKLRQATQTLANLIAAQNSVTTASVGDFCTGARLVMSPFVGQSLSGAIAEVTNNQQTQITAVDWQDTSCGNAHAITNAATLAAPLVVSPGTSVVMVQATFTYQGAISIVLPATITWSRTAYARPRQVAIVTHG